MIKKKEIIMTGIGDRLSSGVQYGNEALCSYTGRSFPKTMQELKNNVSKNVQSCAKLCSAFLDSSLGMSVSMGVLGLATASVCLGEDVTAIISNTLLTTTAATTAATTFATTAVTTFATATASPSQELAHLCLKRLDSPTLEENPDMPNPYNERVYQKDWSGVPYGSCQVDDKLKSRDIFCVSVYDYQSRYPYTSLFQCASNMTSGFLQYVFIDVVSGNTTISNTTACMVQEAYEAMKVLADSDGKSRLMPPPFCTPHSHNPFVSSNSLSTSLGAYCWYKSSQLQAAYPQFFPDTTNCTKGPPIPTTGAPSTTFMSSTMPSTTLIPLNEGCAPCNSLMLAFGVGSAVVLIATVGKVIYNQCKASCSKKSKNNSKKSTRLASLILEDGLLLGASGLGTGVFVVSLLPPCGPVSESTKKMVVASTALYWASAASRLLMNCITSPILEEPTPEEGQVVELPMLEGGMSEVGGSGTTNEDDGEDSSTSKSCCC